MTLTPRIATIAITLLMAGCAATGARATPPGDGQPVRVLTFNIRYGTADDGPDSWPYREQLVYNVIRRQESDFVGLQEALRFQIDGIRAAVPGYDEVGKARDDGAESGEYSGILYRSDRWRVLDNGTFWLSDTPAVPGSTSWGNEITRIVTWARFVDEKTGLTVRVFNTHFDHLSQPSREKSAELLARRIADQASNEPLIVTGDFNAGETNAAILYLKNVTGRAPLTLVDTFRVLHPAVGMAGTFNKFDGTRSGPKIDYVFVRPGTIVRSASIIHDASEGRYPSDHFPVHAEIVLPAH